MSEVEASEETTLKNAKMCLELWLKEKEYRLIDSSDWTRWTYGEPFWAVSIEVFGMSFYGRLGLHIHDTGEILCVTKNDMY